MNVLIFIVVLIIYCVITSYSIHYTKLYDIVDVGEIALVIAVVEHVDRLDEGFEAENPEAGEFHSTAPVDDIV